MSEVLVVGAGIVGASVADALARRGLGVVLLEAGPPTEGSSAANAGHLVPSHVVPFAAPGMVRAGLRSLLRRDGAFALSPRLRPEVLGWLLAFARACDQANVRRAAPALAGLLDSTLAQVRSLAGAGADLDFDEPGLLAVFSSAESLAAGRHEAELMRELGYPARDLDAADVAALEPVVRGAVGGVLLTRDARVDPARLLTAVRSRAQQAGAELVTGRALRVVPSAGGVSVSSTVGTLRAAQVVIAAGVWTAELVARAGGPHLPIVAAKGYGTTVRTGGAPPSRPLLLVDQRLAVTPLRTGLRITGRFELTSPTDRAVPAARIETLLRLAGPALGLRDGTGHEAPWSGLRPVTPDGLPIVGRLGPGSPVLVAAGHGMLGTSMGLGTGALVADLLTGSEPAVDPAPLDPARFVARRRSA